MDLQHQSRRLDFYKNSTKGKILRALTLNDLTFWATDAFVSIVLVLYAINFIEGGSATHVGLSYLVYKSVAAALSIPAGRFFDRHKGKIDEVWGLAVSSFLYGAGYILLSFSDDLWELYAIMALLGAVSTVSLLSWRTLFFNSIEKTEYTETVGIYQTAMFIGQGMALALGGFVGDTFGFEKVVFFGGVVIFLGGFLPLSIRYLFKKS